MFWTWVVMNVNTGFGFPNPQFPMCFGLANHGSADCSGFQERIFFSWGGLLMVTRDVTLLKGDFKRRRIEFAQTGVTY
jgi:hypothetical protein